VDQTEPEVTAQTLIAAGEELLKLKESKGWAMLVVQLEREREDAKDALCHIDPTDTKEIMKHQNAVYRLNWIEETITEMIHQAMEVEEETLEEEDK